jgi:integrase
MSVYKDAKRNTWYVKFRYSDWKNETKWITKRGFPTKREATQWEQDFLARQAGDLSMSFEDFAKVYENDMQPRLKESTWETKKNIINTKLIPYFRNKKLCEIKPSDVVQWQNEQLRHMQSDGRRRYSPSYLKTVHNQLSAMFNHAVRYYNLQSNPARIAGNMGSEKGIEMTFWTKDEYLHFAETMMEYPRAYYCFEMLYWCGIREGELLALTRSDFDFKSKSVSITKTFHRSKRQDIITDPKTPKSRRTVVMPDFLCEEMKEYFHMCYDSDTTDRVFPVTKSFLYHKLRGGAERAGLKPIRVHDLRHSHVSLLIHMGFSAVAIANRMGHENIDITFRYAHLFPSVQTEMAGRLNQSREEITYVSEKQR